MLFGVINIAVCVLNDNYVGPLSSSGCCRYFLKFPNTFLDPVVSTGITLFYFWVALTVWALGTYGLTQVSVMTLGMILLVAVCKNVVTNRAEYVPCEDMKWTQDSFRDTESFVGLRLSEYLHLHSVVTL